MQDYNEQLDKKIEQHLANYLADEEFDPTLIELAKQAIITIEEHVKNNATDFR